MTEYRCPLCEHVCWPPEIPEAEEGVTFNCQACGGALSAVYVGADKIEIVDAALYSRDGE